MPVNDLAVNVSTMTPIIATKVKPTYLILLQPLPNDKKAQIQKFIAVDKPEILNGFVNVKGIFCNSSEEKIMENYADILTKTAKDLYFEMNFPNHRIISIQSLVYKQK